MAEKIHLDATGMNNMIRSLKKYNNVQTRKVVRSITGEVLAGAAKKTKTGSARAVTESVNKNFRKPHEVPGVGFIGITKSGRVWVNLARWNNKQAWALIGTDGKLKNMPKQIPQKSGGTRAIDAQTRADVNKLVKAAKQWRANELKYRKGLVGMSKATWYHLMRMLRLKIPSSAPKKAQAIKLPPAARAALRAWETTSSKDNYTINIKNAVQASLNNDARGIGAFNLAFNNKVKEFERATAKDAKGFAKKFAARNGFEVK